MTDKMVTVIVEGQKLEIPAELASDDEKLKKSLAVAMPEVANATISRSKKEGVETITIVKKSGVKGR